MPSIFSKTSVTKTLVLKESINALDIPLHFGKVLGAVRGKSDRFESVKAVPSKVLCEIGTVVWKRGSPIQIKDMKSKVKNPTSSYKRMMEETSLGHREGTKKQQKVVTEILKTKVGIRMNETMVDDDTVDRVFKINI